MTSTSTDDEMLMAQVLGHCEAALERGDCPVAAIIVRDAVVVGVGSNRVATTGDATAHAETEAIRDACARLGTSDLGGSTLYSAMEPCPMCCWALKEAGINMEMISTSEIRISVVMRADILNHALQIVHTAFGLDGDAEAVVYAGTGR